MQNKILSNIELKIIGKRIDEINQTLDLCHEVWDADVIENLGVELDQIIKTVEISLMELKKCS